MLRIECVKKKQKPLMRPFSCRVFMDGRLVMNFLSLFFTPFLSALSEALCFSLELLNMSAENQKVLSICFHYSL